MGHNKILNHLLLLMICRNMVVNGRYTSPLQSVVKVRQQKDIISLRFCNQNPIFPRKFKWYAFSEYFN